MLRTKHLESGPIRVIVDNIESPTDDSSTSFPTGFQLLTDEQELKTTVEVHSSMHNNTISKSTITNIKDKSSIHNSHNPIFTVRTESMPSISNSNEFELAKCENTDAFKTCLCSKSSFIKLCENPKENTSQDFKQCHKKGDRNNEMLNNKSNLSTGQQTQNRIKHDEEKDNGCHWTCGTKMFSKSEKV